MAGSQVTRSSTNGDRRYSAFTSTSRYQLVPSTRWRRVLVRDFTLASPSPLLLATPDSHSAKRPSVRRCLESSAAAGSYSRLSSRSCVMICVTAVADIIVFLPSLSG